MIFGDIVGSIFGSDPEVTQTSQSRFTPEQRSALKFILPLLREGVEEEPQPSALESASLQGLEDFANQLLTTGVDAGPSPAAGASSSTLIDLLSTTPEDINPFLEKTVDEPLLELLNEQLIPDIENRFAGNQNFFGGERIQTVRDTTEDVVGQIARERARASLQEVQNVRSTQLGALGVAPEASTVGQFEQGASIANLLSLLGGGQTQRQINQDESARRINQLLAAIGIPAVDNTVVADEGREGGIGDLALAAATFFSDRRLKRNIVYSFTDHRGINWYTFKYIWSPLTRLGVMADEVQHLPGVVSNLFGFKRVDYNKLALTTEV